MNNASVRIENVTKQYPGATQPAVSNLSLTIPAGAVYGLLGPNGAGKSTLVMMLCGLLRPDAGTIVLEGTNGHSPPQLRKHIGVAPQEIALYPTLTAAENLFYFGRMYGLASSVIKKNIALYLDVFGLTDNAHKRVQTFSGGMKRRLNLIAALLHDPSLLILDEPTAGVDVQSRNLLIDFLKSLKSKNITIIYTSHFLDEAERLCSRIAIIDEGKLVTEGVPSALIGTGRDHASLEELFLNLTGKKIRD